ncbi:dihydropteroate synthase [Chitinophagaceae bacterium 26-R-25]|nr:dihydropteroate synthase [Chitinophagaceae bacterium 26-R-25]
MYTLNCKGRILEINKPLVMGIINITPDSFFTGSRQQQLDGILRQAEKMLLEGAAVLDIGGQSTRPGSDLIAVEEELQRVVEPVKTLHEHFPEAFISVDTFYSKVAKETVENGACIINDISGGTLDDDMLAAVGKLNVPYICMHMRGTPQNMHEFAHYENVTREVLDFFVERIDLCKKNGIHDVIVDPGLGFAKTFAHNFEILKNLSLLKILEKPLLIGLSRKGMIYRTLGTTAEEALNGTTVLNTVSLMNGANILRVHDVREAVEAVKLVDAINSVHP